VIPVVDATATGKAPIGEKRLVLHSSPAWNDRVGTVVDFGFDSGPPRVHWVTLEILDAGQRWRVRFPMASVGPVPGLKGK
jgi:hypothetical protein